MTDLDVALRLDASPELRLVPHAFQQVYGDQPAGVWQAPGALTLLGEPDERHALALPLRWGAVLAAGPHPDGLIELRSMNRPAGHFIEDDASALTLPVWAEPTMGAIRALRAAGHDVPGVRVLLHTDLPAECGIPGAVTSLASASVAMLESLVGVVLPAAAYGGAYDLAAILASLSCPDAAAVLVDRDRSRAELLPFDLGGAGLRLMLIDLGVRAVRCPRGRSIGAAAEASAQLAKGDLSGIGALLSGAEDLSDEFGEVIDATLQAGALGSGLLRRTSSVAADCIVSLVPVPALADVRHAVRGAWNGARPPRFLTATASRRGSTHGGPERSE